MLKNKLLVAALASAFAMPAMAEFTPSSNVSLVSDYLYRGISQSGGGAAIQGGFDLAHSSGAYIGMWGSSISWLGDAGGTSGSTGTAPASANAGLELDIYGGYKGAAGPVAYDVGFLRYNYPGTYAAGVTKPDTNEVYGAATYSIVTAKLSYALGDLFGVSKAKGSTYLELNASYPIADTGITVGAHYGKQTYKGTTAEGLKTAGTDPTYSDYKLSVSKDFSGYVVGAAYSKTNAKSGGFYTNPQGKDLGKGKLVLSLSRSF
ncbi:MAG TPA: TorF family putative porin [Sideroxyarcus sp.]|nr:TorF family putative porin [Sideroxyarcus sp.]